MGEPSGGDEHSFDRRKSDVNVAALADRMMSIEGRVEILEDQGKRQNRELEANTALTKQVHEAVFGVLEEPGLRAQTSQVHEAIFGREGDTEDAGLMVKVKEVHGVFTDAKRGFQFLNSVADTGARWGKPLFFVALIGGAIVTWWKTGEWHWPSWAALK